MRPVFGEERVAQRSPVVGRLPVMLLWKRSREDVFGYWRFSGIPSFFKISPIGQNLENPN